MKMIQSLFLFLLYFGEEMIIFFFYLSLHLPFNYILHLQKVISFDLFFIYMNYHLYVGYQHFLQDLLIFFHLIPILIFRKTNETSYQVLWHFLLLIIRRISL
jgi:hypothetical protein